MHDTDVIVIGSGRGGLTAAALLARYGKRVIVCESQHLNAHYLRRYQGSYGPAIAAGKGIFPSTHTPISGLYRVGDSTMPGIGVPVVAASGILCANSLVKPQQTAELLNIN